jgi:hypothetical protein
MLTFRKKTDCVVSSNLNLSTSWLINPKSLTNRVAFDNVHCQTHQSSGPSNGGFCAG